jgi:hypothetical protein
LYMSFNKLSGDFNAVLGESCGMAFALPQKPRQTP